MKKIPSILKIILGIIFFLLIFLLATACDSPESQHYKVGLSKIEVVLIDSCQYLTTGLGSTRVLTHKGNCKNHKN